MALTKRDGSKAHNWPAAKTVTTIETDAHTLARRFITSCNHLTPAKEVELDNLLKAMPKPAHEPKPATDEPNPDILEQLNTPESDWMDDEPTEADLQGIEREERQVS
jgi:hypothetical protein